MSSELVFRLLPIMRLINDFNFILFPMFRSSCIICQAPRLGTCCTNHSPATHASLSIPPCCWPGLPGTHRDQLTADCHSYFFFFSSNRPPLMLILHNFLFSFPPPISFILFLFFSLLLFLKKPFFISRLLLLHTVCGSGHGNITTRTNFV